MNGLSLGETYHTDKAARNFLEHIGGVYLMVLRILFILLSISAYFVMNQLIDRTQKKVFGRLFSQNEIS